MDNLRDQQQRVAILKQVASQPQNQPRPISAPPVANMPLPPYPQRRPSDKGSTKQVQAENANALCKSSDSETDRLQDIQEEQLLVVLRGLLRSPRQRGMLRKSLKKVPSHPLKRGVSRKN